METNNETVEQVALSDRPLVEQIRIIRGNYSIGSGEFDALDEAADVVECHQREIVDFQRRYDECVRKFNEADLERVRRRDEVAAKDAEIEKLKACRDGECERIRLGAEPCEGCHVQVANDEIAALRALVKELNECLREAVIEVCHGHACCGTEYECNGVDGDCFVKRWRAALAKAAGEEVANGQ